MTRCYPVRLAARDGEACYGCPAGDALEGWSPMVPVLAFGPFTVATHDVFTVLALAVGLGLYYADAPGSRHGSSRGSSWISVAAILGGALGARLITAWEHLEYYAAISMACR